METTLIILKPDAVQRGLMGRIISRFEDKGLSVVGAKLMQITPELAARHYKDHASKPFYPGLVRFMTSAPVVVLCLEGPNAIAASRQTMGATRPPEAAPGTIRADFGLDVSRNIVHGSDSPATAAREVALYFKPEELIAYTRAGDAWLKD